MAGKKVPVEDPRHVPFDEMDMRAIKALHLGIASDSQQKRALDCIINRLARTYDLSARFGEDADRLTTFAEGKRFVGLQVVRMINMPAPASGKT